MFILIVFPLYLLPGPNRKKSVGLTLGFANTPFLAMMTVPRQQWHGRLKIKHLSYIEEVYNSLKVLSWHLSRLIFYRVVIPTDLMDYILGTMIVFSGGKSLHRRIDTGLHAGSYALIMKYHAYANV